MRVACATIALALLGSAGSGLAQTRRPPAARALPTPALKTEVPEMVCPEALGTGVKTQRSFCDVMTGRDPAGGIIITLPPHRGPVTLTFDLHNRHTYSEEQMKDPRMAFSRYVAAIGVLTMDNTLVRRAAVENEFRTAADLVDRIGGGAGPAGVKAVAPTGLESIKVTIPEAENKVSLLGEAARSPSSATCRSSIALCRPRRHAPPHALRPAGRRVKALPVSPQQPSSRRFDGHDEHEATSWPKNVVIIVIPRGVAIHNTEWALVPTSAA
jgi:hypothetical protein